MKCKFPGCTNDACGIGDARHYCCVTHYNQHNDIKKGKLKESDLVVKCELCGIYLKDTVGLTRHLASVHNITLSNGKLADYYKQYMTNGNENVGKCLWCGKPTRFTTLKRGFTKFCHNTDCNVRWYNINSDRLEKASRGISKAHKKGDTIPMQVGYWLKKGMTKDEAIQAVKNRQATNTVEAIMLRDGLSLEDATAKRRGITCKWSSKVHTGINYSKISQELFWSIWDAINEQYDSSDVFFATFHNGVKSTDNVNHEFRLPTNKSYRLPDFYIKSIGLIIEFDGTFHHSDSWRAATCDTDRDNEILSTYPSYTIVHISEDEYMKNKEGTLLKCLDAIQNTKEALA